MKDYRISEQTAAYIEAIRALENAKEKVIDAFTTTYGEDSANTMFNDLSPQFDAIGAKISEGIYINIAESLYNKENKDIL